MGHFYCVIIASAESMCGDPLSVGRSRNPFIPFSKLGANQTVFLCVYFSHSGRHRNDFSQVGRIRSKLGELEFLHSEKSTVVGEIGHACRDDKFPLANNKTPYSFLGLPEQLRKMNLLESTCLIAHFDLLHANDDAAVLLPVLVHFAGSCFTTSG